MFCTPKCFSRGLYPPKRDTPYLFIFLSFSGVSFWGVKTTCKAFWVYLSVFFYGRYLFGVKGVRKSSTSKKKKTREGGVSLLFRDTSLTARLPFYNRYNRIQVVFFPFKKIQNALNRARIFFVRRVLRETGNNSNRIVFFSRPSYKENLRVIPLKGYFQHEGS